METTFLSHGPAPRPFAECLAEYSEKSDIRRGMPAPLGAHALEGGVNFALFSRYAQRVRLELYREADELEPMRALDLDPARHRTGDIWHIWIKGVAPGQLYAYRVDDRLMLDPFAVAIKAPSAREISPRCIYLEEPFDWRDDKPPRHPWSRTVIYETHVRGLTAHASSQVLGPGTFRGLTEKIPYFQELGVTAIEVAAYRGPTGATEARLAGLAQTVQDLQRRRGGDLQVVRFAEVTNNRLADLTVATRAAASMPSGRRRATLGAVARDLDRIDADLMTFLLPGTPAA